MKMIIVNYFSLLLYLNLSYFLSYASNNVYSWISNFDNQPVYYRLSASDKIIFIFNTGKAFAVTTTMEKIGPFATTPLFVLIYTNFIKTYPCPVWFLPAGFCVIIVILAIVVQRRWRILRNKLCEQES